MVEKGDTVIDGVSKPPALQKYVGLSALVVAVSVAELPAHIEGELTDKDGLGFTVNIIVSETTQPKFVFTVKRTMAGEEVTVMLAEAVVGITMLPAPVTKLQLVEFTASPGLGVALPDTANTLEQAVWLGPASARPI